jgi:hypothetical protein
MRRFYKESEGRLVRSVTCCLMQLEFIQHSAITYNIDLHHYEKLRPFGHGARGDRPYRPCLVTPLV